MSYDCYRYEQSSDSSDVLALFKLNGNYQNEVADSDISLVYNGNSFVNGKFDGALKLDGSIDMQMIGDFPNQYTVEFWFYNAINNGSYTGSGTPYAWHHSAYTYDNGTVRVWFNGVESTRGTRPCININVQNVAPNGVWWSDNSTANTWIANNPYPNLSLPSVFGNKLPSTTVGATSYTYNAPFSQLQQLFKTTSGSTTHWGQYLSDGHDNFSITGLNPNDPLHYYPQFTQSHIDFGFTGSNTSVGNYTVTNGWNKNTATSGNNRYYRISENHTVTNTTTNNYVDMSDSLMDEIRVTNGLLYTESTFTYPQDEFTYGHIWVRPEGDDFNVGDIAVMSPVEISDYRIGGADYSYPSTGNVYIGLSSNIGLYAKVYNGQNWLPCDFGVWNGSEWADGDYGGDIVPYVSDPYIEDNVPNDVVEEITVNQTVIDNSEVLERMDKLD
ncbi:unnamed protein product, partial [Cylicocyclus nassatus]